VTSLWSTEAGDFRNLQVCDSQSTRLAAKEMETSEKSRGWWKPVCWSAATKCRPADPKASEPSWVLWWAVYRPSPRPGQARGYKAELMRCVQSGTIRLITMLQRYYELLLGCFCLLCARKRKREETAMRSQLGKRGSRGKLGCLCGTRLFRVNSTRSAVEF